MASLTQAWACLAAVLHALVPEMCTSYVLVLHISTGGLCVVLQHGTLAAQDHRVQCQYVADRLCLLQWTWRANRPGNSTTCLQMLGWTALSPPSKQTRLQACLRCDLLGLCLLMLYELFVSWATEVQLTPWHLCAG